MGLIQAAKGSAGGFLADQWREFFYCDAMDEETLAVRGFHSKGGRSTNFKGSDNIISNGSVITVNEGQCMIIVDQGEIVEVCAEAGEYLFDTSKEPSIFFGSLGENLKKSFQNFMRRASFGGDEARVQRIYYFNTKEILGNKYGTANPVPFRVVDSNIGLDIDIAIKCFGEYAYKMVDPILFYKNICGNITEEYTRDRLDSQLKSEILTALQPAFARISEMGVRYSAIPAHTTEIAAALNEILSSTWGSRYGLKISTFGVNSVTASEEDEKMIKELQKTAAFRNPIMAAAQLAGAQAAAMQAAASNPTAGPMMAFAGMNMAQQAGGFNAQQLFAMGQPAPQQPGASAPQQTPQQPVQQAPAGWTCPTCAQENNQGRFCSNCGTQRPE